VDAIPCYQTVQPEPDAGLYTRLRSETPDLIVFTSPKAIRNFLKTAAEAAGESYARRCVREAAVAAIGPVTAGALEAEGKSPEIIPSESTVPALLTAIARFFQNR
jgi:uroporphyrinogen-III synthase